MPDPACFASTASPAAADMHALIGAGGEPGEVPEFLWYDLALEALGPDAPGGTRLSALRLLARVPRAWDAVLMAALTTTDLGTQLAALAALTAHVEADPSRLAAFEALGDLPAWHPPAREAWAAAWGELAQAHEEARRARELREMALQAEALVAENAWLRTTVDGLRADVEAAITAEGQALERIDALEASTGAEIARLEEELARERQLRRNEAQARDTSYRALEAELAETQAGRRRWSIAAWAAAVAAIGPLASLAIGHAPVLATEPPPRPAAIEAQRPAPAVLPVVPGAPIAPVAFSKLIHPAPARPAAPGPIARPAVRAATAVPAAAKPKARPAAKAPAPLDPIPGAVRAKF